MGIAFGFRFVPILIYMLSFWSNSDGQDCNGVYIDNQCHTFRFDIQNWASAENTCNRSLSVAGYTGAHLTSIGSANKQREIEIFMDRFGIIGTWIGATNKPLLWQWLSNEQVLQAQGCYKDDPINPMFSYRAQIAGLSSEGCIDACLLAGYGYAGIQGGGNCMCAHTLNSSALATGCTYSCTVPTSLSPWCGGSGLLTTVYKIGGANGQWGYNQPDITPTQRSCGVLDMSLETKMADEDCTQRYDYLCQMNLTNCTGYGYQQLSSLCYYVSDYQAQNGGVNWDTAANRCQEIGGKLATVDNNLLQMAIRNWLASFFTHQSRKIWIGSFKGGWYWLAGYSFSYTNWAPGEPKRSNDYQCAFVDQTLGYKWLALPCNISKVFICQRGYDVFTTPSFTWNGPTPTPPTDSRNGTGSTMNTGTGSTGSTGSTGGTGSTGSSSISGSSFRTVDSTSSLRASSFADTTENSIMFQEPSVAPTTQRWSKLAIGLFALLAIILFLLLLLGLIFLALCIAKNRAGGNKVDSVHHYDARPIAHIPNSGEEFSSTVSLKNAAEPVGTS